MNSSLCEETEKYILYLFHCIFTWDGNTCHLYKQPKWLITQEVKQNKDLLFTFRMLQKDSAAFYLHDHFNIYLIIINTSIYKHYKWKILFFSLEWSYELWLYILSYQIEGEKQQSMLSQFGIPFRDPKNYVFGKSGQKCTHSCMLF